MADFALPRQLHALGQRAIVEAAGRRAGTVEAEHLMLAILADRSARTARLLASRGLTYDVLVDALDRERARSLSAAGIGPVATADLAATPGSVTPGWGASIRTALRSADKPAAKDGTEGALERELAIALLRAEIGTLPRALAIAELDRVSMSVTLASQA